MKLELGSGHRGTRGFTHHDAIAFPGIDIVAPAWDIDLPDNSVEEVLALGFVEHLTYFEALDTFRNVHRMLLKGGVFVFDVPDYPTWARYYLSQLEKEPSSPYTNMPDIDECRKTLFGWGRWPGDEHKYGWDRDHLTKTLKRLPWEGFSVDPLAPAKLKEVAYRDRFSDKDNAHLYVRALK